MARPSSLSVAVTGPTGTFGFGLVPLLDAEPRVERIVGVARRPFDPAAHGWRKMTYRRGDVRDPAVLEEAFAGVDVVVHLAFRIAGAAADPMTREINVDGTVNALRAAAAVGASRFVYASSVAAYGFHADNPMGITEDWPTRPAAHLFYAQEKAELEETLVAEAAGLPDLDLYVLRPPIVVGPHVVGGKSALAERLLPVGRRAAGVLRRSPVRPLVPVPDLPLQLVHEDDVGQAFLLCVLGAGPPGAYNIAGDGVVTGGEVARELGLVPLRVPSGLAQRAFRRLASVRLPSVAPPVTEWAEALSRPSIMDTSKAKRELGWVPRYTGLEALRATIDRA